MQWDNYAGTDAEPGIFRREPLRPRKIINHQTYLFRLRTIT